MLFDDQAKMIIDELLKGGVFTQDHFLHKTDISPLSYQKSENYENLAMSVGFRNTPDPTNPLAPHFELKAINLNDIDGVWEQNRGDLTESDYNPDHLLRMLTMVVSTGTKMPAIVVIDLGNGKYKGADGKHRSLGSRVLGYENMLAYVLYDKGHEEKTRELYQRINLLNGEPEAEDLRLQNAFDYYLKNDGRIPATVVAMKYGIDDRKLQNLIREKDSRIALSRIDGVKKEYIEKLPAAIIKIIDDVDPVHKEVFVKTVIKQTEQGHDISGRKLKQIADKTKFTSSSDDDDDAPSIVQQRNDIIAQIESSALERRKSNSELLMEALNTASIRLDKARAEQIVSPTDQALLKKFSKTLKKFISEMPQLEKV